MRMLWDMKDMQANTRARPCSPVHRQLPHDSGRGRVVASVLPPAVLSKEPNHVESLYSKPSFYRSEVLGHPTKENIEGPSVI